MANGWKTVADFTFWGSKITADGGCSYEIKRRLLLGRCETATRMGYYAVQAFAEGRGNCIIATKEGSIVELPIEEALQQKKHLQMDRYRIMEVMQYGSVVSR